MKRVNIFLNIIAVITLSSCNETFVATNEWQKIAEGQPIPQGLHIRINLQTGVKEAKLLADDNKKSKKTDLAILVADQSETTDQADDTTSSERKLPSALRKEDLNEIFSKSQFEDTTYSTEKYEEIEKKYKSYKEIKDTFKDMDMSIKTEAEMVNDLMTKVASVLKLPSHDKTLLAHLEDLEYLAHNFDNALWFVRNGGLEKIIVTGMVNQSDFSVKINTIRLLGALAQNNPNVKVSIFETNILTYLTQILMQSWNDRLLSTTIYAYGAILRNFPHAQYDQFTKNGMKALWSVTVRDVQLKTKLKVIRLLWDLMLEGEAQLEAADEGTGDPVKTEQYKNIEMVDRLKENGMCDKIHDLFTQYLPADYMEDIENVHDITTFIYGVIAYCFKKFSTSLKLKNMLIVLMGHLQSQQTPEEQHVYGTLKLLNFRLFNQYMLQGASQSL